MRKKHQKHMGINMIQIPPEELIDINLLKVDGKNPNVMTEKQHKQLAASIKKWGFIVPVITNNEYLIADGEQRFIVAKDLGMKQVRVIKLPVREVDRRLLRQVLNKLKGEHDKLLDAEEFQAIIDDGEKEQLQSLLDLSDDKLLGYLNKLEGNEKLEEANYLKTYEVVVECKDEADQEAIYNQLTSEGFKCRVLTL